MLILSLVEARPRHGYEIGKLIEARSGGKLTFALPTLYPRCSASRTAAGSGAAGSRLIRLLQFQLNTGAAGYDRHRSEVAFRQVLEAIQALPGVDAATLAVAPVLDNALIGFSLDVEGYSSRDGTRPQAAANVVAPGYFRMVGTPLMRGRDFSEADTAQSRRVAIVSEAFVERYFPNLDPIGRTIGLGYGGPNRFQHEIVGISKDARLNNLRDEPTRTFYLPYTQFDVLNGSFFSCGPAPIRICCAARSRSWCRATTRNCRSSAT